jgi:uncharacterized membrane protein YczE
MVFVNNNPIQENFYSRRISCDTLSKRNFGEREGMGVREIAGSRLGRLYDVLVRVTFFLTGLWLIALGVVCTILARLGVAPWDVFHIGLARVTSLSIGFWVSAVGVVIVLLTCWLTRSLPKWGTVGNMLIIGVFIDWILWLDWIPHVQTWWARLALFFAGMILNGLGVGLYIAPRMGAGPRDGLTLELSRRTGWSIRRVRTIMELSVGIIGWLLGGPVQIGTLFFCVLTGPMMQIFIPQCERLMQTLLKRGVTFEDIDQGALRTHHNDGSGIKIRKGSGPAEECG